MPPFSSPLTHLCSLLCLRFRFLAFWLLFCLSLFPPCCSWTLHTSRHPLLPPSIYSDTNNHGISRLLCFSLRSWLLDFGIGRVYVLLKNFFLTRAHTYIHTAHTICNFFTRTQSNHTTIISFTLSCLFSLSYFFSVSCTAINMYHQSIRQIAPRLLIFFPI